MFTLYDELNVSNILEISIVYSGIKCYNANKLAKGEWNMSKINWDLPIDEVIAQIIGKLESLKDRDDYSPTHEAKVLAELYMLVKNDDDTVSYQEFKDSIDAVFEKYNI